MMPDCADFGDPLAASQQQILRLQAIEFQWEKLSRGVDPGVVNL